MCFVIPLVSIRFSIQFGGYWSRDKHSAGYRNDGSDKCGGIPMDSLITAAPHALAAGDPLGALKRVALRDLGWPAKVLDAARSTLEAHGDRGKRCACAVSRGRCLLLIGRLDETEHPLAEL
jgi:hypothetical protein